MERKYEFTVLNDATTREQAPIRVNLSLRLMSDGAARLSATRPNGIYVPLVTVAPDGVVTLHQNTIGG